MKRLIAFVLALSSAVCLLPAASAQTPPAPEIAARNFVLFDVTANQLLAERQADQRADPASLTKLMTAWLAFDALKAKKLSLEQAVPVSMRAWRFAAASSIRIFGRPVSMALLMPPSSSTSLIRAHALWTSSCVRLST